MITGVLRERLQRRNEAVADITSSWGSEQNVIGPVLGIPYQYKFKVVKEVPASDGKMERREVEENGTAIAWFLPETLHITGDVQTQMLHRGIYDAAVFRAQVTLSGKFRPPDFGPLKIDVKDLQWKDAFVTIAVNDLRGAREALMLDWGGTKHSLLPGSQVPGYTPGATASLGTDQPIATESEFSIPLDFNGSEGIYFAPFGVQNEATLKSNWPDPAFRGAFLPAERSVRPDGFDAKWKVSYYGRDYPQSWTSRTGNERFSVLSVTNSRFGVQLLSILDAYRYVERSIKYGVLFLVLVFTTFFLFEVTARQKIHPFQYLMVGAHANDWRRSRRCLHISLHHFAPAGLCTAHGRDRTLHRAGDRNVRDAQSRLVRARCGGNLARGIKLTQIDIGGAVLYHATFARPNRHPEYPEFSVNPTRFDPYKNSKFRVKWDGRYVAGVSKISGLRRTTEVIQHRERGDPRTSRKSLWHTEFAPIALERGVTHDPGIRELGQQSVESRCRPWRASSAERLPQRHCS